MTSRFGRCGLHFAALFPALLVSIVSPSQADTSKHCSRIPALVEKVSTLRKLQIIYPVTCRAVSDQDFVQHIKARFRRSNSPEALQQRELVYKAIGFIPERYAYARCAVRIAADEDGAFYDESSQTLFIRRDAATPDWILIHELVHALQDQHFQLKPMLQQPISGDGRAALRGLLEGDAIAVQLRAIEASAAKGQPIAAPNSHPGLPAEPDSSDHAKATNPDIEPSECSPPGGLADILLFSYDWGRRFVRILQESDRPNVVDAAFRTPPRTSRDILYPKHFLSSGPYANQMAISRPRILLKGYAIVLSDSFGEYFVRSWLRRYLPPPVAILAAKGWVADKIQLLKSPAGPAYAVRWQILFESEAELKQFLEALRTFTEKRFATQVNERVNGWNLASATLCEPETCAEERNGIQVLSDNSEVEMIFRAGHS